MTTPIPVTGKTPIYGIEYLVPGEPVAHTRAKLQRNAEQIEAALVRGGIAPAGAQDLATLSGRVSALEKPRCTVRRTTTMTLTGSVQNWLAFTEKTTRSPASMWNSANPTRLIAPESGEYDLTVYIPFPAVADQGGRSVSFRKNGNSAFTYLQGKGNNPWYGSEMSPIYKGIELVGGDYLEIMVLQNSVPSMTLTAGAGATLELARR